jgi:broad specificity phosphatase PhoE
MEVNFGSVEGLTFEEAVLAWPEVANRLAAGDLEIDWPRGETWPALRERIAAALDDVRARAAPVLVVGHGIAIRVALTMLGGPAVARESRPVLPAGGLVVARDTGHGWALETPEPEGGPA